MRIAPADDVAAQCGRGRLSTNLLLVETGRFVMWLNSDSNYQFVVDQQKAQRQAAEQARLARRGQRRRWWKRSNPPQSR